MGKIIQIPLGGKRGVGKFTIVDESDYHLVKNHNWSFCGKGYAACKIANKTALMHRLIMSAQPDKVIDHKNHDGLDNRRDNLRECTYTQNIVHSVKQCKTTSKYKGVCFRSRAKVRVWRCNVAAVELGSFKTEEEAAKAYDKKVKELYGEFAVLNFPQASSVGTR